MGTIHIHSNKADDLYFLNELARRMNLETNIETPENEIFIGKKKKVLKNEEKKLAEMAFLTSGATLEKFFEKSSKKSNLMY